MKLSRLYGRLQVIVFIKQSICVSDRGFCLQGPPKKALVRSALTGPEPIRPSPPELHQDLQVPLQHSQLFPVLPWPLYYNVAQSELVMYRLVQLLSPCALHQLPIRTAARRTPTTLPIRGTPHNTPIRSLRCRSTGPAPSCLTTSSSEAAADPRPTWTV